MKYYLNKNSKLAPKRVDRETVNAIKTKTINISPTVGRLKGLLQQVTT